MNHKKKFLWVTTHPIAYQIPLLNLISKSPHIDLTVLFFDNFSDKEYFDHLFNKKIYLNSDLVKSFKWAKLISFKISKKEQSFLSPIVFGLFFELIKRRYDYVLITGWNHYALVLCAVFCKLLGIKIILRSEAHFNSENSVRFKLIKYLYLKLFDYIGFIGKNNRIFYENILSNSRIKFLNLPYSIDNEKFKCDNKLGFKQDICLEYGFDKSFPLFLFVGKLTTRKNIKYLISVFHNLTKNSQNDINLLIVGSGILEQDCKIICQDNKNIKFAGFKDQSVIKKYYAGSDILIIPSTEEPWGLVVNEAMASGCAIIASDKVYSCDDLLVEGYNGLRYSNLKNDLPNAIIKIINLDYIKFGKNSVELVNKYNNYSTNLKNIEELFKNESKYSHSYLQRGK